MQPHFIRLKIWRLYITTNLEKGSAISLRNKKQVKMFTDSSYIHSIVEFLYSDDFTKMMALQTVVFQDINFIPVRFI